MLHLDPGIHLHEIIGSFRIKDELHGSRICIVYRPRRQDRVPVHGIADLIIDGRRGRLLDQLLMVSLDRTVTLAQRHHVAELVRHDLDLHMARVLDEPLDIHGIVAECIGGFPLGHVELKFKLVRGLRHAHAFAAAAGRRLDHHRIADLLRQLHAGLRVIHRFFRTRHDRYAGLHHGLAGMRFISHAVDDFRFWSDEGNPVLLTETDKIRILGEESEPRMDSVRAHIQGCGHDALHIEVAVLRRPLADADPLVGQLDMQAVLIFF